MKTLLIANRGEIAVRIARAAAELGVRSVAVFSEDDAASLHVRRADDAAPLSGIGAAAYLDVEQLLTVARATGADAVHPGYGFLSESPHFARRCEEAGVVFVGPRPETLEALGDKTRAREIAARHGAPVLRATASGIDAEAARAFVDSLPPGSAVIVKAVAGAGGRGMRVVRRPESLEDALARCASEASAAFGDGSLYVEELMPRARHVEIQIAGDGSGAIAHLGERECSIQRRHQKLVEIAPSPALDPELRDRLAAGAVAIARSLAYRSLGTFEFLVACDRDREPPYAFIEANPRLQVEHTVTEEVMGVDLVRAQLELARGASLADLGLDDPTRRARGFAIQVRVNTETIGRDGTALPTGGTLTAFDVPTGPGVRTDTAGYVGWRTSPRFDSLLAKVVASSPSPRFADAVARARRAVGEMRVEGVCTNLPFLQRILEHPDFAAGRIHTGFIEEHAAEMAASMDAPAAERASVDRAADAPRPGHPDRPDATGPGDTGAARSLAGARVDPSDPLAVLAYGKEGEPTSFTAVHVGADEGPGVVRAFLQGTIVAVEVREGDAVRAGQPLVVMSAMKMEHVVESPAAGVVRSIHVAPGDTVPDGHPLVSLDLRDSEATQEREARAVDLDHVRPDLAEVERRRALTRDAARPDAVARRRKTGQRTARENVDDLCDPGSFVEYGTFAIAAQRQRRSLEDLIERTPADGLVAGIGRVNGDLFDESRTQCAVLAYDYTVLAGTQGFLNHRKKDRMFELAERMGLPVVFFTEGGGGRPGDTDAPGVAGLDCMAFHLFARLSGRVPLVGINSGRCFAGNAALLGTCDVIIATANSNIGMGGPAMIEGGGLGVFRPEEVGPMRVQVPNGVVDIPVADEAEAVDVAKKYLAYFQGPLDGWTCADQRALRHVIPENRLRVYEVREVIDTLADTGSVLELRRGFGHGMVTALARVEGRPIGIIANDPKHLAGAIDSPGADKAARFMQLCDAFGLPILFLCDTPGIMVGPEVEKTALVRHCCRMFVVGANLSVPFGTIVLRKSYGLGAQAMGGGSHKAPLFTVSWPTGEFGGMGLEGAVKLGFRKELAGIGDPAERLRTFEAMVERAYERGKALSSATHFEIDDVIDPAGSRARIASALRAAPGRDRALKVRPCVDTW